MLAQKTTCPAATAELPKMCPPDWPQTDLSDQEQKNLDLILYFMNEGISRGNLAAFDACVAADVRIETGLNPTGPIDGVAEFKAIFGRLADAWFIIDEAFAVAYKVVIRFQAVGYFRNEYFGLRATREIINKKEIHVLTVRVDKIVSSFIGGTNFPFEYIMYPLLKDAVIGNLPLYDGR